MEPKLVRDLMTVGVPTCPWDTTILELTQRMLEKEWEAVVVLESEQGHAIGVVSRDDLVRAYVQGDWENLRAEQVMSDGLHSVPPDIPITTAAQIMGDLGVRALYITHRAGGIEYPAAMLTYTHLLRHLSGQNIADLGIQAERKAPLDEFLRRRDEALRRATESGKSPGRGK